MAQMTPKVSANNQSTAALQAPPEAARWPALCSVVGPILFTLAWVVLGLLRPGYSSVSRPVSALGIGPNGSFMDAAFVVAGLLLIIGVIAALHGSEHNMGTVARWSCTLLLMLSPLGMLWAGIFTMNTLALHTLGAEVALGTPVITFPIVGLLLRRVQTWRRLGTWMLAAGPLTLALLVGFSTSVPPSEMVTGGGSFGLWQRALIVEVLSWYAAIGWRAFQSP